MSSEDSDDVQIFIDDRNVDPSVPSCSGYKPKSKSAESKKKEKKTSSPGSSKRKKEKPSESSTGTHQKFLNSPRNFVPAGVRIKDYLRIDPMTWNVLKNLKYAKAKAGGRGNKAIKIYSDDEMDNENDQTGAAATSSHTNVEEMFARCDEIIMNYLPDSGDDDDDDDDESFKQWRKTSKHKRTKCVEGPLTDEALVFHYTNSSLLESDDNELKDSDEDMRSEKKPRIKHRKKINYKKIHQKKVDIKKHGKGNSISAKRSSGQGKSTPSPDSGRRPKKDPTSPKSQNVSADTGISGKSGKVFKSSVNLPKPCVDKDWAAYKKVLGNRIPRVTLQRISIKGNSLDVSKGRKSASKYAHSKGSLKNKKGKGKLGQDSRSRKVDLLPHEKMIDNRVLRVSLWKPIDKALHGNLK